MAVRSARPFEARSGRAATTSFALVGVEAVPVEVQVSSDSGLPGVTLVGLPDTAVRESRERVLAAFKAIGLSPGAKRITVNLAPAELRKEGAGFDLPIALGILAAIGVFEPSVLRGVGVAGELSLDGALRPVRGALAMVLAAARAGMRALLLPGGNWAEASGGEGTRVHVATNLAELVLALKAEALPPAEARVAVSASPPPPANDLALVRGQAAARRALEIAAAGGHNLLLVGPPGAGKTLLAQCLPGILPALSPDEAQEVTLVHSVAGRLPPDVARLTERPFRAPHHTITPAGLVGGGAIPRPGEVSLAHRGVLFLDEMPEFRREVLNLLRQPIEEGALTLVRSGRAVRFPCRFMLVGAMNP